ncbi:MAG TPA: NosD domain-containing protein, partial [Candidatus Lokiarchaeia archaeon]|nr:NosD domain-containing protein [Candidatus Lokiarchaeia archaeon]
AFQGTTRFVIIQNCVFTNISGDSGDAGISFVDGIHLRVINCTFNQCENGMIAQGSQDVSVINSTFSSSKSVGLKFDDEVSSYVTQNSFVGNAIGFSVVNGGGSAVMVTLNNFTSNTAQVNDNTGKVTYNSSNLGNSWSDYWTQNPTATINLSRPIYLNGSSASAGVYFVASAPYMITSMITDNLPLVYFATSKPLITVTAPVMNQVCGAISPSYSVIVTGSLLTGAWIAIDGSYSNTTLAGIANFTSSGTKTFSGTLNSSAWAGLLSGTHTITSSVRNWFGNMASQDVPIVVDLICPAITIVKPIAANIYGRSAPTYNLSIVEDHPGSIWYSVNGSSCINASGPVGVIDAYAWGMLGDGSLTITFWSCDIVGNIGTASESIVRSTASPQLIVTSPNAGDLFNATAPSVNVSLTDLAPTQLFCQIGTDSSQYLLGSGASVSTSLPTSVWQVQPDGFVSVHLIALDSLGNQNSTVVTLQKDTSAPAVYVTFTSPAFFAETPAQFAYSASDPHLNASSLYYTIDGKITQYPLSVLNCSSFIDATAWGGLSDGIHYLTVYAADYASNVGSATITFTVDLLPPIITVLSSSNYAYSVCPPYVEVNVTEDHLARVWYMIDAMPAQFLVNPASIFPGIGYVLIDTQAWYFLPDGIHNITFWASDVVGHQACSNSWWVKKDATGPAITAVSPANGAPVNQFAPTFAVLANDPSLVKFIGYSLDGGKTITWLTEGTSSGNISQAEWDKVYASGASITITFYAMDSLNNTSNVTVIVTSAVVATFWTTEWFSAALFFGADVIVGAVVTGVVVRKKAKQKKHTEKAGRHTRSTVSMLSVTKSRRA